MTAINLTISLPDNLAEQAEAAGLLEPQEISRMVEEGLLRKVDAFNEMIRKGVEEALADPRPLIPHEDVFAELRRHHAKRTGA